MDLFHTRRENYFFSASPAACSFFPDRLRPVGFSCHRVFLRHADGTPAPCLRPDPALSRRASFPHTSGLAQLRLVRDDFWFLDEYLRHSPAPHLQREALLVSRDALWRNSIWSLREPQSLRWIRGISSAALARSSRPGQGEAGALGGRRSLRRCSHRRAFPLRFPGRHREFWRRAGCIGPSHDSAARQGKAIVCRRCCPGSRRTYGLLARRRTAPAAIFFVSGSLRYRRETRPDGPGHPAKVPP